MQHDDVDLAFGCTHIKLPLSPSSGVMKDEKFGSFSNDGMQWLDHRSGFGAKCADAIGDRRSRLWTTR